MKVISKFQVLALQSDRFVSAKRHEEQEKQRVLERALQLVPTMDPRSYQAYKKASRFHNPK